MKKLVRVKAENGSEVSVTEAFAARHKLEVLPKSAADARGIALNEKPHIKLAPAGTRYDAMKPEELKAEADQRQVSVEGTGKDGNVLKSDLVAALVLADKA